MKTWKQSAFYGFWIIFIFIAALIACGDSNGNYGTDPVLNGTWIYINDIEGEEFEVTGLELNNGNYKNFMEIHGITNITGKGIYNTSNGLFSMQATHFYITNEDSLFEDYSIEKEKWYTKNELKISLGSTDQDFDINFDWIFESYVYSYSVNNNDLIFTIVSYPEGYPYVIREIVYLKKR